MAAPKDRRTGFSRRRQYGQFVGYVAAIAGAIVGAVLLVLQRFDPPGFAALRMGAASVTAPVAATLNAGVAVIVNIPADVTDYLQVHADNRKLRDQMRREHALLIRARAIVYDNRRLRALLAVRDRTAQPVVAARLVGSTASSGRRFALLDAGRWNGVEPGMPVRGPDGVIGRIVETGPAVARVLLLTDAESLIPVRRTRDGLPAIAAGKGDGTVEIRSVTSNTRFDPGDLFVTTGVGGIYPPDLPTVRVTATGIDSAPARPFAQLDGLDFALVERQFMAMPPPRPEPK